MRIKVIDKAWYGNKLYDPDLMPDDELIIEDYPEKETPSWAEEIGNEKPAKKNEGKGEGKDGEVNNTKVNDLPLVEKNALIEEAKAVGIEGNQILSWKVDTLKAKIEAKKNEGKGEDDKGNE